MKSKKRAFMVMAIAMAITTINTVVTTSTAVTSSIREVDNDSIAPGCGNVNVNNAYSYITDNSLFNGDARCVASGNTANTYHWKHGGLSSSVPTYFTVHVGAYLNHLSFTDPAAKYYVEYRQYMSTPVGTINQNLAPAGWNYISVKDVKSYILSGGGGYAGYWSSDAYVEPSGRSGYYTGADAIRVWFTY
ncbi:MAG: hypothetical protein NC485_04945 [Ruminococcus flavefaciens]|nr:hypothetical protein [Ruminococcus flavefaciens]MCM1059708.1 hypothetical protein [Eubacterium sp.]